MIAAAVIIVISIVIAIAVRGSAVEEVASPASLDALRSIAGLDL